MFEILSLGEVPFLDIRTNATVKEKVALLCVSLLLQGRFALTECNPAD